VVVLRASAITTFSACLRHLFGMWLSYLGIYNHSNANIILQTTYSHIPDRRSKQAEKVVIALAQSTTPEDGQIIMTETCRVFLIMCFTNILNNLEF